MDDNNNNNNNNARSWSNKNTFKNSLLFSNSKPTGKESNVEESIKAVDNRLKALQAAVKELQAENNLILEMLTIVKGQLTKAVAEVIFPSDDWIKLRTELRSRWPRQKTFSEDQLKEIIEDQLHLDTENAEHFAIIKIAIDKMKNYLRGTLLKTFDDQVTRAIDAYLQNNDDLQQNEIDHHVERILTNRQWTKVNPTQSDILLAKDLITEEIQSRVNNGEDENPSPPKRRRLDKSPNLHPGVVNHQPSSKQNQKDLD